jgi:hypothetical protein
MRFIKQTPMLWNLVVRLRETLAAAKRKRAQEPSDTPEN